MYEYNKYNNRYLRFHKKRLSQFRHVTPEQLKKENEYKKEIYTKIQNNIKIDINEFADFLRTHPTLGEYKLNHEYLNFDKKRFKVQKLIKDIFIADFYIRPLRLIIEVDGSSHINKEEYDKRRDRFFTENGYNVLHIEDIYIINKEYAYEFFIADVIKYLLVQVYHKKLNFNKGEIFRMSPLLYPKPGQLDGFSETEKSPVKDPFKIFETYDYICKKSNK